MKQFCENSACETPAVTTRQGCDREISLCFCCAEAFDWGIGAAHFRSDPISQAHQDLLATAKAVLQHPHIQAYLPYDTNDPTFRALLHAINQNEWTVRKPTADTGKACV